jgi:hypothetical protein
MEQFYLDNDLDPRAAVVEQLRVELVQALQSVEASGEGRAEDAVKAASGKGVRAAPLARYRHPPQHGQQHGQQHQHGGQQQEQQAAKARSNQQLLQAPTARTWSPPPSPPPPPPPPQLQLDPALAAERVAALSLAAAQNGELAFLSPFGAPFMQSKAALADEAEAISASGHAVSMAQGTAGDSDEVLSEFTVVVSAKDYFEIMRRRGVHQARVRREHAQHKAPPAAAQGLRYAEPFQEPPRAHITTRTEDRSQWVSDKDFHVSAPQL